MQVVAVGAENMSLKIILLIHYLAVISSRVNSTQVTCDRDVLDRSFVTQCGPSLCEPLVEDEPNVKRPDEWPKSRDEVVHIVSTRAKDRLKVNTYKAIDRTDFYYEESHVNGTIFIDTQTKYQRILGFGTTLTDASSTNADDLPEEVRKELINDYFNVSKGIGLNLIKVPIGSTKYSYSNYVLDQPDNSQVELSPYDTDHRISIIRDAMKAAGKFKNRVKILASAATAPQELKDNNRIVHGGHLKQDSFQDYASYLIGFIKAYKAHGLDIWALILTESPVSIARDRGVNDTVDYSSMAMRPSEAIKLIKLVSSSRSKETEVNKFRLLLLGDDRAYIPVWVDAVLSEHEVSKSVAGVAFINSNQSSSSYDNLIYAVRRYPNKYLLATQGSINAPMKLGSWQYAENYVSEIVKNLEYGAVGWLDFNLALNLEGGPCISQKFKGNYTEN